MESKTTGAPRANAGYLGPMPSESEPTNLPALREKLAAITGGTPPRTVLAELAQSLAADLAAHFDELPMHPFAGYATRSDWLKWLLPKVAKHRVLMGRYVNMSTPQKASEEFNLSYARIAVLGIGDDGVLRRGVWRGLVRIPKTSQVPITPLRWDDLLLRNVPPSGLVMREWTGSPDPGDVASPAEVIETLNALASRFAAETSKDLDLLNRLLGQ